MTEEQKPTGDIATELRTLGQQLGTAIKALWESEDTRGVRQEIRTGFVELGQHIDGAIKTAQDSEAGKQFGVQVKQTVEKAKESDVAAQIEQGIVTGLQELNKQLSAFVSSWTKPGQPPTPPPPAEPGPSA